MINPKSLINLEKARAARSKPNAKRCNFTLRPQTVRYLKKYSNMSSAVDEIVAFASRITSGKVNQMFIRNTYGRTIDIDLVPDNKYEGQDLSSARFSFKIAALEREVKFLREQNSRLRSQLNQVT